MAGEAAGPGEGRRPAQRTAGPQPPEGG